MEYLGEVVGVFALIVAIWQLVKASRSKKFEKLVKLLQIRDQLKGMNMISPKLEVEFREIIDKEFGQLRHIQEGDSSESDFDWSIVVPLIILIAIVFTLFLICDNDSGLKFILGVVCLFLILYLFHCLSCENERKQ